MIKIKVIGIGGSGCNTINRIKKCQIKGVELIALNTDIQDLAKSKADIKLRIGPEITQGLGAGMKPEIGRKAALESRPAILEVLKGADLIFLTYGAGGGTGSGAGPVVAGLAKELGILTVAIITKPFSFEGQARMKIAENGIRSLRKYVDTLVLISNNKLLSVLKPEISLVEAFCYCDDILRQAVQGISDLISLPGIINVNFADIKSILKNAGSSYFGIGQAQGENRAVQAALSAIKSPLLDVSLKGAKGILFNVSGGKDISLTEINEIAQTITAQANPQAKIIFGAVQNEKIKTGEIKVTVIATGF